MKKFEEMSEVELKEECSKLNKEYEDYKAMNLKLNMARGIPSTMQLDESNVLLDVVNSKSDCFSESGNDCRSYGVLEGIPEARNLMAEIMNVSADNVYVCGNASLNIMYDTISSSMLFGVMGSTPWCKLKNPVKFLCPVPGYDRHFKITELLGIEMINIPMTESGPDMDMVEKLVSSDSSIKGIWCVPKFSNPQGVVYSDETVHRFANLKPAASDFRIFWDNAYAVHYVYEDVKIPDILLECEKAGNPDMIYEFCSTSKVSFAGGGISAMAASKANLDFMRQRLTVETIGYDKVNQLRHVRYFKNIDGVMTQMKKHADILRPKFDMVINTFINELGGTGAGKWTKPMGGYFVSFEANKGCAKKIVAKCKEAGVTLTGAGAPFPYGKDPEDSVIRIAPSYPPIEELETAMKLFVLCVKLVTVEKLLEKEA